jgi:hypothetical protein
MRRVVSCIAVVLVALVASACGVPTLASTSVRSCRTTADCHPGTSCLYSVYESCGNPGVCIATSDAAACVPQTACGCDGATETVCLVNGNSPSPILALGSCDGATQQGYDANVPPLPDSSVPPVDAADVSAPPPPPDSAPEVDSAPPPVDAADATPSSTYGSPCQTNSDCTDAIYNQCGVNNTCTKLCTHASQCPVPPTLGTCNLLVDLCD